MRTIVLFGSTIGLLVAGGGCAKNSFRGDGRIESGQFSANVGITGHGSKLTIESGSKVPKLSIIGDDCTVTVEDGANVGRIEFWGNGNTVSVPADLLVYVTQAGVNTVVHRQTGAQTAPPE